MKAFFIVLAIVLVAAVLLRLWNPALIVASSGKTPKVKSEARVEGSELITILTLVDVESPLYIMALDVPRPPAEEAGLGPPGGFHLEALEGKRSDPEWIANWNKENLHFAGKLALAPNAPTTLRFPLTGAVPRPFEIRGQLESGRTFLNSMTFFRIQVGA